MPVFVAGVPCLYYGTEQGLHGRGNDEAVCEALWGGPGFDRTNPFYKQIAALAATRAATPALRYGRFYFRPVSAASDGTNFGITTFTQGVLAFSRILNDEEVVVAANTNTSSDQGQSVDVIVDGTLNGAGAQFKVLYSNKPNPAPPGPVRTRTASSVTVHEVDGSTGHGPISVVRVTLGPMEVQILGR